MPPYLTLIFKSSSLLILCGDTQLWGQDQDDVLHPAHPRRKYLRGIRLGFFSLKCHEDHENGKMHPLHWIFLPGKVGLDSSWPSTSTSTTRAVLSGPPCQPTRMLVKNAKSQKTSKNLTIQNKQDCFWLSLPNCHNDNNENIHWESIK